MIRRMDTPEYELVDETGSTMRRGYESEREAAADRQSQIDAGFVYYQGASIRKIA